MCFVLLAAGEAQGPSVALHPPCCKCPRPLHQAGCKSPALPACTALCLLLAAGVFQGPGPNCSVDAAAMAVDDVAAAVDAALHRTRSVKWHSMR